MVQFHTFDQYVSVLSVDAPHALVQDWWTRLERQIRIVSRRLGYEYKNSAVEMINALEMHPVIEAEVIEELQAMRRTRNAVVHDLNAPALSSEEAEKYARRAWTLGWYLSELY